MKKLSAALVAGLVLGCSATLASGLEPDPAKECSYCEAWNEPIEGFRVHGSTYYVGTAGLSAILVVTGDGLVLIDGALSQSAPLIEANIRALGFDPKDIRIILNSHAHYDHAGGIHALQRYTGAQVYASQNSIPVLSKGDLQPDDPQYAFGPEANGFPAIADIALVMDGGTVTLGESTLTAIYTPGHTPGGTTWTWESCENGDCVDIVYADSISPVSADGFLFGEGTDKQVRASAQLISGLPCDVLMSPHPFLFQMREKLAKLDKQQANPFIDPQACQAYGAYFEEWLDKRLLEELAGQH